MTPSRTAYAFSWNRPHVVLAAERLHHLMPTTASSELRSRPPLAVTSRGSVHLRANIHVRTPSRHGDPRVQRQLRVDEQGTTETPTIIISDCALHIPADE
jgi:hypothetical protein